MEAAGRHLGPGSPGFAGLRSPRQILFGDGQRGAVGWLTATHGSRAFVCADSYLVGSPELHDILESLHAQGVATAVHADVIPEMPVASVDGALNAAREFGADVVVAVGGGSSIDLAKLVSVLLAHGGEIADYYGENRVPGPTLPVIAVPTTAGTGSEVTPVAVLTDTRRNRKVGVSSAHLIPVAAVCDPELTLSCPPEVTASSGTDALSHCIEAYTAVQRPADVDLARTRVFLGRGAITDTLALTGMRHIVAGLRQAYADPTDRDARACTMYGALMAGLAFGTAGTAAAHALQYPIGALTGTPHGVGVGVLLPYVMSYNRAVREKELAEVARVFGGQGDDEELAAAAPALVSDFLAAVGIPRNLAAIGMPADRLDWAAAQGPKATRLAENNPAPLTEREAGRILRAAWAGDLSLVSSLEPVGDDR